MGQGSFTTLPLILRKSLMPTGRSGRSCRRPGTKTFGNPDTAPQTSASNSVHGYFRALRIAGAQARRVLLDAAAANGTPVGELSTGRAWSCTRLPTGA
jgi:isoquinoline 1-oxidoreductase beta subunit